METYYLVSVNVGVYGYTYTIVALDCADAERKALAVVELSGLTIGLKPDVLAPYVSEIKMFKRSE